MGIFVGLVLACLTNYQFDILCVIFFEVIGYKVEIHAIVSMDVIACIWNLWSTKIKKMSWKISFHVIGDNYSPKKVNFKFHEENEADEIAQIGRFKGKEYGYGSSSYTVPKEIERLNIFQHLADTFEPMIKELKMAGAESWHIDIARFYFNQCNEEFGKDELIQITRLNCPLTYSAYSVTEEEEKAGIL